MRRHLLAIGVILGTVFLVYSNSLRNGFVWDDHIYIENNPFVRDPANLKFLFDARYYRGTHEVLMGSRPVVLATFLVDRALWGDHPAGYHAANILLHSANSVLIYALSCALGLPPPLSFWAAMFFGLHPVQTEAVNGVSFRADLLAAFFVFSGLWVYLWSRGRKLKATLGAAAASAALFGLGLLSKEMAAALPLLVLLAEFYFPAPKGRRRRLGLFLGAYALVACAFGGFWAPRFRYESMTPADSPLRSAVDRLAAALPTAPGAGELNLSFEKAHHAAPSSWEYREAFASRRVATLTMIKAFAGYFHMMVMPFSLTADRAPVVIRSWSEGGVLFCLAWLLLVGFCAVRLRRAQPAAAFGAAWCLAALLPVANFIPLYNPVAERYLYLAAAGAALVFASVVAALARGDARMKRFSALAGWLIAAGYGLRAHARNADWKDDRALFLDAPAQEAQSARSGLTRGGLLLKEGRVGEAEREYEEVVRRQPDLADGWLALATANDLGGAHEQAAAGYRRAMELSPHNPAFPFAYALFLDRTGKKREAAKMYERALEIEPGFAEARMNLSELKRRRK